ncbi:MAG: hypothetical protein OHK0039_02160 [Bacteroidia bacterium]
MYQRFFGLVLLCTSLLTYPHAALADGESRYLRISALAGLPSVLTDTSHYDLTVTIINADPQFPLISAVKLMVSVSGDTPTTISEDVIPAAPIAPGDSFSVTIPGYGFDPLRFQGGGITHDIIVWPMRLGASTLDSAQQSVQFHHTLGVRDLGLQTTLFPQTIHADNSYDLAFVLINKDTARHLFGAVQLYLSIDGDAPTLLTERATGQALAPGGSVALALPAYTFDPARFNGGGITHDIIVWPMTLGILHADTLHFTVHYKQRPLAVSGTDTPMSAGTIPGKTDVMGASVVASPNPVSQVLYWQLHSQVGGEAQLVLYHSNGKPVLTESFHIQAGVAHHCTHVATLAAGRYFYTIRCQDQYWSGQLIKH